MSKNSSAVFPLVPFLSAFLTPVFLKTQGTAEGCRQEEIQEKDLIQYTVKRPGNAAIRAGTADDFSTGQIGRPGSVLAACCEERKMKRKLSDRRCRHHRKHSLWKAGFSQSCSSFLHPEM